MANSTLVKGDTPLIKYVYGDLSKNCSSDAAYFKNETDYYPNNM